MNLVTAVGLLTLSTLALRFRSVAVRRSERLAAVIVAVLGGALGFFVLHGLFGLAGALGIFAGLIALAGVTTALFCERLGFGRQLLTGAACLAVAIGAII